MRSPWILCLVVLGSVVGSLPGQAQSTTASQNHRREPPADAQTEAAPQVDSNSSTPTGDWADPLGAQYRKAQEERQRKANEGAAPHPTAPTAAKTVASDKRSTNKPTPVRAAAGNIVSRSVMPKTGNAGGQPAGGSTVSNAHPTLSHPVATPVTSAPKPGSNSTAPTPVPAALTAKPTVHAAAALPKQGEGIGSIRTAVSLPKAAALPPAHKAAAASVASTVRHKSAASAGAPATAAPTKAVEAPTSEAKPDLFSSGDSARQDHPLESPLQTVGEGWKMIAYLLPTLVFILVCLNLLRRYQQKNGKLPAFVPAKARVQGQAVSGRSPWAGLLGSLRPTSGKQANDSAIRLVETVSVGGANLHLVQVRDKVLLLGATGNGVSVLTEFDEEVGIQSDEFRVMLQAAAAGMDSLDLPGKEIPTAVVGSLDYALRDTGDAMARRIRRLRTVQEVEENDR